MAQISCFEAVGPSALLCRLQEDVFFSLIGMIMPSLCMGLLRAVGISFLRLFFLHLPGKLDGQVSHREVFLCH